MSAVFWAIAATSLMTLTAHGMVVKAEDNESELCVIQRTHTKDWSKRNLTEVPHTLPGDTQYLDLSYNPIARLDSVDLSNLPHLCYLKLTHSRLQYISPSAFEKNAGLKVLNVSHNFLTAIPDLAWPQLRVLDLSGNQYDSYALGSSFRQLTHLTFLSLGSPKALALYAVHFAPLRHVGLKKLSLGEGFELQFYEPGSLAQIKSLREIALKMPFCQRFDMLKVILTDLNQTEVYKLRLIEFLPAFCNISRDPFEGLKEMRFIRSVTFVDTWINSSVMLKLLENSVPSPIEELAFVNITYNEDTPDGVQFFPRDNLTVSLKSVLFNGVLHYQYSYPKINISVTCFSQMTYLKFSGTGMNISPCNLISAIPALETLDLSDNLLSETGFWWPTCSYAEVFPVLRQLLLSHNRFVDLAVICKKTHQIKFLEALDLSFNSIVLGDPCSWPFHLKKFNLSNNNLGNAVFGFLSPHFRQIDLSKTGITAVTHKVLLSLPNLTHLYLSSNGIQVLPTNLWAPTMLVLHVDQNAITTIAEGSLEGLPRLEALKAGNNPFSCSCDSYWFVTSFNKHLLPDWPQDYTCGGPPSFTGVPLREYKPTGPSCLPWLQASITVPMLFLVIAVFSITFYVCDGIWYTKMLWVWIRVKRRGHQRSERLQNASFRYHAFISYSQNDSAWVEAQLVSSLEKAGLSLCVHERDFVPGLWIIDNIISSVEESYKTLFVLSQNFVQSEWCNYELFFAQHRAISIQQDSLVFILLEPIPADSLPRKFLKLRALLQEQTYLEWPKDERKQQVFWASLRAMLETAEKHMVLKSLASDLADTLPLLEPTS